MLFFILELVLWNKRNKKGRHAAKNIATRFGFPNVPYISGLYLS